MVGKIAGRSSEFVVIGRGKNNAAGASNENRGGKNAGRDNDTSNRSGGRNSGKSSEQNRGQNTPSSQRRGKPTAKR